MRIRERAAGILPAEEAWMPTFVTPWLNSSGRIVQQPSDQRLTILATVEPLKAGVPYRLILEAGPPAAGDPQFYHLARSTCSGVDRLAASNFKGVLAIVTAR